MFRPHFWGGEILGMEFYTEGGKGEGPFLEKPTSVHPILLSPLSLSFCSILSPHPTPREGSGWRAAGLIFLAPTAKPMAFWRAQFRADPQPKKNRRMSSSLCPPSHPGSYIASFGIFLYSAGIQQRRRNRSG